MIDLNTILPVQEADFGRTFPAKDIILPEDQGITINFLELLAQLGNESEGSAMENTVIIASEMPEVNIGAENEEKLTIAESGIPEQEGNPLPSEDIEENNALLWINFPDFHPPQPLEKSKLNENAPDIAEISKDAKPVFEKLKQHIPDDAFSGSDRDIPETKAMQIHAESSATTTESENIQTISQELSRRDSIRDPDFNENLKEDPERAKAQEPLLPPIIPTFKPDIKEVHLLSERQNINLPVKTEAPEWGTHFNQQILFLGKNNLKSALIRLNPENLGPVEINIQMTKNTASLRITSHSPEIRELITQALPDLQRMMTEQGLNLLEVNVESQSSQSRQHYQQYLPDDVEKKASGDEETPPAVLVQEGARAGLVDYFA